MCTLCCCKALAGHQVKAQSSWFPVPECTALAFLPALSSVCCQDCLGSGFQQAPMFLAKLALERGEVKAQRPRGSLSGSSSRKLTLSNPSFSP